MTRQEMFNTAYLGLASQGFQRSRNKIGCAYRSPEGHKCAAGYLIKDELYTESMESHRVGSSHVAKALALSCDLAHDDDWELEEFVFLSELQGCHDNGHEPELMKQHLAYFASEYNLEIPEVPTCA